MKHRITMSVLAIACLIVACWGGNAEHIKARSLTITNERGDKRLFLYAENDTARIQMYNKKGQMIMMFSVLGEAPSIVMSNRQMGGSIALTATPLSQVLTFNYPGSQSRLTLANFPTHSQIQVGPSLTKRSVILSALESGTTGLVINDDGQYRAGVLLGDDDRTTASLWSAKGERLWQAP